ncbi:hypothetical protein GCM10025859_63750 [Alicyclobacillus fastidiosus]|nr:hypothetical protein GCM10025859_62010 [Alicyclobacillus fastidiosus]GMA65934.1 hypothetical protein GCM10025859_63750 [Alicyclobacillus fastidiosus]
MDVAAKAIVGAARRAIVAIVERTIFFIMNTPIFVLLNGYRTNIGHMCSKNYQVHHDIVIVEHITYVIIVLIPR